MNGAILSTETSVFEACSTTTRRSASRTAIPESEGGVAMPARSRSSPIEPGPAPAGTSSSSTGGAFETSIATIWPEAPVAKSVSPLPAAVIWLEGPGTSVASGIATGACGGANAWSGPLQPFMPSELGTTVRARAADSEPSRQDASDGARSRRTAILARGIGATV